MTKCGGCGRFLSAADAARCQKCSALYHRRCVALPVAGTVSLTWHCPECKRNRATDNKAETPVRGVGSYHTEDAKQPSPTQQRIESSPMRSVSPAAPPLNSSNTETAQDITTDITSELRTLRDNLRYINRDLQLFRDEMADIRASLITCKGHLEGLEERVSILESRDPLELRTMDDAITQVNLLKDEINDRDQAMLASDVEITNLPETNGENPTHTALQIAVKLGLAVEERDIVSAERVGPRRVVSTDAAGPAPRPRPLAVRFARRQLRDELLSGARARRGVTSADLGIHGAPRRFYVNERLTKINRQLFRKARDAGQHCGWKYVWCKHGRILVRNKSGDKAICIRNDSDINRVFYNNNE